VNIILKNHYSIYLLLNVISRDKIFAKSRSNEYQTCSAIRNFGVHAHLPTCGRDT